VLEAVPVPETSFLAALRGSDGRSLARAMAILLLLNLFAAGFHLGAHGEHSAPCFS